MKVDIPSFGENLDIESFLNWIYEVDKFFDMTYVLHGEISQICSVQAQERRSRMVESIASLTKTSKKATYDDTEAHEATPTR